MTDVSNGADTPGEPLGFSGWVCPAPLRDSPNIVMGHGGGGAMSSELIEHLFLPAYGEAAAAELGDSAVVDVTGTDRLAFSTDSFVVKPMFFPGGSIGDLAVNGTVNDLAMSGARPLVLSIQMRPCDGMSRLLSPRTSVPSCVSRYSISHISSAWARPSKRLTLPALAFLNVIIGCTDRSRNSSARIGMFTVRMTGPML